VTERSTLRPANLAHGGIARLEGLSRDLGVLALGEQVGIDASVTLALAWPSWRLTNTTSRRLAINGLA
jgi:hypothetical protein